MALFTSTMEQLAFLFSLIVIGYLLGRFKVVPENSSTVLSKLENVLFVPALVMGTFIKNFTVSTLSSAWKLLCISLGILLIVIPVVMLIVKLITKDKYLQNIYTYGLVFSNFGFMGNAVVAALFPEIFLEYIIFTLPLWMGIYLWGAPVLLIADNEGKQTLAKRLKAFKNPMIAGMLIGMVIGISGLKLPEWLTSVVTVSGDCMSPVAMLLTGMTVATIDLKKTFTNVSIYAVTFVRLIVLPLILIGINLICTKFFVPINETVFLCALCSLAMPLGLNTIVIPRAYGKDTSVAAGMAVVSHLLSCLTIPLIFSLI
ncbi:MAG: AEC family transporter [Clostridia bacterium]|nr:AEC family transporter [Clostridia bacterium]